MEIRPYQLTDREACLRLFDSNVPGFFAPEERDAFEAFLTAPPGTYYVMEHEGEPVGCGGFAAEPGLASLTWGLIRRDLHGKGLGRWLLFYRLREIGKLAGVTMVRVRTTPAVEAFFARVGGFHAVEREPDGWGPGLDRVTLVKRLSVCG